MFLESIFDSSREKKIHKVTKVTSLFNYFSYMTFFTSFFVTFFTYFYLILVKSIFFNQICWLSSFNQFQPRLNFAWINKQQISV